MTGSSTIFPFFFNFLQIFFNFGTFRNALNTDVMKLTTAVNQKTEHLPNQMSASQVDVLIKERSKCEKIILKILSIFSANLLVTYTQCPKKDLKENRTVFYLFFTDKCRFNWNEWNNDRNFMSMSRIWTIL